MSRLLARKLGCSVSYLLSGVTEEDADSLRSTLQYAQIALQNGEAEEARAHFAAALETSHLAALPDLHYEARWGHALALEACGRLECAVAELERIVARLSPESDPDKWATAHIALCRCHRERGDFTAGMSAGEEGLRRLTEHHPRWTESMVMLGSTLLSNYLWRGDLIYARQFADRLIERAEEEGGARARAAAYWNAAIAADYRGDTDDALSLVERALALLGETNDLRNLARLREEFGRILLRARPEEAERARKVLRQARQEQQASSASSTDLALCDISLAKTEIALGDPGEAVRLANEAIERMGGAPRFICADALLVLGHGLVRLGSQDEAVAALRRAAEQLEGMRSSHLAAQAWLDLAELFSEAGSQEQSVEAYRHALSCIDL